MSIHATIIGLTLLLARGSLLGEAPLMADSERKSSSRFIDLRSLVPE